MLMHCCANRCIGSASSATHWRTETAIAFAGEKRLFLARISVAEVMVVSCWPASVAAMVSLVSTPPRGCVLCAKKFALRGLVVGVSAKKFALHAQNTPKSAFLRLQGELFRGRADEGAVLGEVFRGSGREGMLLGELCRACEPATASVPGRGPATSCRPHGQALRCLRHPL